MTLYKFNLACNTYRGIKLKPLDTNQNVKKLHTFSQYFCAFGAFIVIVLMRNIHVLVSRISVYLNEGVLECEVPESERFYIGNLPIYTF